MNGLGGYQVPADEGLAARVGPGLRAGFAALPAWGVLAALRRRRARVTAALAGLPVAAVAVVAAAFLPGSAVPAARDAAYVAGRPARALAAVPPGAVFFMQKTGTRRGGTVFDMWARLGQLRREMLASGRPLSESGFVVTGPTRATVVINYRDRTWSRQAFHDGGYFSGSPALGSFACDSANEGVSFSFDASRMAALLRGWESCGWLKADGTATVGGVAVNRLVMRLSDNDAVATWYVRPATGLPVRETLTQYGKLVSTTDVRWLPPTPANLAKLALPVPPRGFTRVAAG